MRKLLGRIVRAMGYEVRRKPSSSARRINIYLDPYFARFYKDDPFVFLDVGARGGIKPEWTHFEKYLKVIAFEPDREAYKSLVETSDPKVTVINGLLYNKKAEVPFYITRGGDQSSLLRPNRKFTDKFKHLPIERWDIVQTVRFSADTLDSFLPKEGIGDVDFIKLDTQGSEKFILEGAKDILTRAVIGLEIEVEFAAMYENQPLFAEVDELVRSLGFVLFDIRRCYWRREFLENTKGFKGQLVFGEALYFKDVDCLVPSKAKYLKAVSLCVYFGYFDYAFEILQRAQSLSVIDEHEYQIAVTSLEKSSSAFSGTAAYDDRQIGNAPWIVQ